MALGASRPVYDLLYDYDEAEQPGDGAKHDDYNVFGKDQWRHLVAPQFEVEQTRHYEHKW